MEKYSSIGLIDTLEKQRFLAKEELHYLLENLDEFSTEYLRKKANKVTQKIFKNKIFIRGLIEISSYCKNDCLYCGIRASNKNAQRYRLKKEDILSCCKTGYNLGFRTFVLQGGEDLYYTDDVLIEIIKSIKKRFDDCAVTLSLGERSKQSYEVLFNAGADRYLLRHETASAKHYSKLHPENLEYKNRINCLKNLKEIGFQTGTGFMVGSPYQTIENIVEDLCFIKKFKPHMVGIGPFIPHIDTPFKNENAGSFELTLNLISILRLMEPKLLIPATTALGTIKENGREDGILSGANVVMPNLSPLDVRKKYLLYDGKIATGQEAAEGKAELENRLKKIGYEITIARGDYEN